MWITEGKRSSRTREIIEIAEKKGVPLQFKNTQFLDNILPDISHQGIIGLTKEFSYIDLDKLINLSLNNSDPAILIAVDHITDEGNLGAIIRSAVFFGAHGMILPKDRSARISDRVRKGSAGALDHIHVTRVVNLNRSLDILSDNGFWIIGAAGEAAESIYEFDWDRNLVLVLGNEEKGLGISVRKKCHQLVSIPSPGQLNSLNVSVASGIILSEINRQRRTKKNKL